MSLTPPDLYDPESFAMWREGRDAMLPHFQNVYKRCGERLAGATTILDLGGGDGHTLDVLPAELHARIVTVDADAAALERLKERYPRAHTVHADARELEGFDADSFDAGISICYLDSELIQYEAENEGENPILQGLKRVLKPGAELIYFRDLGYGLRWLIDVARSEFGPELIQDTTLLGPIVNRESGAIEQCAALPTEVIHANQYHPRMGVVMEAAKAYNKYGGRVLADNNLEVAGTARTFTRLVEEVSNAFGIEVPVSTPVLRVLQDMAEDEIAKSGLHLSQETVSTQENVLPPLIHQGKPLSSLHIDAMAYPHFRFQGAKAAKAGKKRALPVTKVSGKTRLYTVSKPVM